MEEKRRRRRRRRRRWPLKSLLFYFCKTWKGAESLRGTKTAAWLQRGRESRKFKRGRPRTRHFFFFFLLAVEKVHGEKISFRELTKETPCRLAGAPPRTRGMQPLRRDLLAGRIRSESSCSLRARVSNDAMRVRFLLPPPAGPSPKKIAPLLRPAPAPLSPLSHSVRSRTHTIHHHLLSDGNKHRFHRLLRRLFLPGRRPTPPRIFSTPRLPLL